MTVMQLVAYLATLSDQQARVVARVEMSDGALTPRYVVGRTDGTRAILEAK